MVSRDRKQYILNQLELQSSVSVTDLSVQLSISEVTVRRILGMMERDGLLRRTWGGAVSAKKARDEPSYEEKAVLNLEEKCAIAEVAYARIQDGDAIYLDSGTTTLQLAKRLVEGDKRKVLICTNALNIALAFCGAEDMEVMLIGGAFHHRILSCSGVAARDMLARLFFDKAFLSGSHFSPVCGVTTPDMHEAEIKRVVHATAKETFFLMDSSKYGADSLAQVAEPAAIGTLITDWKAGEEMRDMLGGKGIHLLIGQEN